MNLKVVCTDNSEYPQLEINKIYDADLIFYLVSDEKPTPQDWDKNFLNIKGLPEIDWFSTKYFLTLDDWRQIQFDKIFYK